MSKHQLATTAVALLLLAVSAASCARPETSAGAPPTRPARPTAVTPPDTPSAAAAASRTAPTGTPPQYAVVILRVTADIDGGSVVLAPPPGTRPAHISAATAFGLARHRWTNPRGSTTPRVILANYTNNNQGTIRADNSIKRSYVHRLTWVVIDYGGTCLLSDNAPVPAGAPAPTPTYSHNCLTLSFVDALTGRDLGSMDEGGQGVHNVSTG